MTATVLIVDATQQGRRSLGEALNAAGYRTATAGSGRAALERLGEAADGIALCLLDLDLDLDTDGCGDGGEVLRRARAAGVPVIALAADGSVDRAAAAMRAGAADVLPKPWRAERLGAAVRAALARSGGGASAGQGGRGRGRGGCEGQAAAAGFGGLVAVSPATRQAIALARRAAGSDIPVLIEGESGTGKAVFARAIHAASARAAGPFVAVDCGALPAGLADAVLFGQAEGAAGAPARRGRFQQAEGGTLFLDEVAALPPSAQARLLRALRTGRVEPPGGEPVRTDVRLISATGRDLAGLAAGGGFREDLFYRLGVFPMTLPPLRARREDIPGLARRFLERHVAAGETALEGFAPAAMEVLAHAPWPGNLRELQNVVHRAVVLAEGPLIEPQDLHGLPRPGAAREPAQEGATPPGAGILIGAGGHVRRLVDIERDAIRVALRLYRGRMAETARRLGIGRSTLYRKLDELRIDRDTGW